MCSGCNLSELVTDLFTVPTSVLKALLTLLMSKVNLNQQKKNLQGNASDW